MVGIRDTFKVGDKIIRWESVIKWMLDWAQKQPREKKEARDSFVKSKKIFKDIKFWVRERDKEMCAKLYHVASNCGLEEECAFYKKSGKVLADRIRDAKKKGRIGAYINKYYQEDSDEWKNAYAVFDTEATAQKEKLKKSRSTDEVVKSLVDVKPGKKIAKQEYGKIYRGAKQKQGCVLGDDCKCKGLVNEAMVGAPDRVGSYIHKKCLERTCDACKEKGTALEIYMKSPTTPGEFVHRKCFERTCDACKEKGNAREICMKSPTTPGEFVHPQCLERTCSFCGEKADARTIFKNLRCSTPGNPMFACRNEACRFQFPFKDPNGCAFCKRKFTCSVKSLDVMEKIWDRHKMKIEPKPKRDACRGCFERRFDLDQTAKREEKLEKILKKDKSELYEKLRKLLPKMKEIINKK